ncbi:MAG: D-aminoacylase [Bacteroidota bacterium]
MKSNLIFSLLLILVITSCTQPDYDVIIRNGMIYDGSGSPAFQADLAIRADTIAFIGNLSEKTANDEYDAKGMAVSPGFINMLSWAVESLIADGRSQSDIRQGVTLEVMGEGWSMGPMNEEMKKESLEDMSDFKYEIQWTTLGEYLQYLEEKGVSTNVASFVGATTLRIHEIGYEDRPPTSEEMERMKKLTAEAMEEGAMGIASSLIYAPAFYSSTEELVELCKVASEYDGMYISHLRSEGDSWLEAIDELILIAKEANLPAEIYHLKAGGIDNWHKLDAAIAKIDSARSAGLKITTDMYNYIAGATGLDASMPPWVQEGGYDEWAKRLQDSEIRAKVKEEMMAKGDGWENLYFNAGSADKLILVGFKNDSLKYLTGKTLQEVAEMRGTGNEETAMDLVWQDGSRVGTVYFLMSEENVKRQIAIPYMSFGSDEGSIAPEGLFLKRNPHPRAYGNFARLLGKYVREEKVIPLEDAIRKLTHQPAVNLKIEKRGLLESGYYADVVVFNPETISDHSTFNKPHQYSTGVSNVWVNGTRVLKDGVHTGAYAGRFVKGPGYQKTN